MSDKDQDYASIEVTFDGETYKALEILVMSHMFHSVDSNSFGIYQEKKGDTYEDMCKAIGEATINKIMVDVILSGIEKSEETPQKYEKNIDNT